MANWQEILDNFSGSKSTRPSSQSTTTYVNTSSSTKKKRNDWQSILDEFSGSTTVRSNAGSVSERVEARTTVGNEEEEEDNVAPVVSTYLTGGTLPATSPYAAVQQANQTAPVMSSPTQNMLNLPYTVAQETREETKKNKADQKRDNRTWFQKGLFEDGWDFGDVARTILGTAGDITEDLATGIIGMGEKALDALAYLAPAANSAIQAQNSLTYNFDIEEYRRQQQDMQEFIQKDLYDEEQIAKALVSGATGTDVESLSVLGEKSDALVQSAGQLAGQYGLSMVGVPWFVTSGLTSFGSEVENAFNEGASYDAAGASAAISAGAEVLSEKLFGGDLFVSGAGSDVAANYLAREISDRTLRTMVKLGIDTVGEGFEEVFSGVMSNLGSSLYREENLGEILFSEEAISEYIESFVGGAVLGGAMGGINAVQSNRQGVDYTSGLTNNEQKVVDKVYNDLLAEAQKDGDISNKEKRDLYNYVLNSLEKGYFEISTIEEVLGEGAQELAQNDRLIESYNERARMGDDFQADFAKFKGTKHEDAARKTLESAIQAGANNSNRVHDIVDLAAQISADTGEVFAFKSGEEIKNDFITRKIAEIQQLENLSNRTDAQTAKLAKLKDILAKVQSGAVTVNGDYTADGITLNLDSKKPLNRTVGHEISHSLEGTESYKNRNFQNSLFAYAKTKGIDVDAELETRRLIYEGVEGANPEAELVADLVGDFLFTDSEYIRKLSVEDQNVFQRVWDEIKYLCKIATAGSQEYRELARVQREFEKAYREAAANENSGKNTRYSLEKSGKGKYNKRSKYSESETLFLRWENGSAPVGEVKKFIRYGKTHYYEKTENGCVELSRSQYNERNGVNAENIDRRAEHRFGTTPDYDGSAKRGSSGYHNGHRDSFGNAAVFGQTISEKLRHDTTGSASSTNGYASGNGLNQSEYSEEASESSDASFVTFSNDYATIRNFMKEDSSSSDVGKITADGDGKYSLSDSDGKPLTKEQQNFFKDSKMRDENGNLKVMYHGTPNGDFTVFKDGTYFTDNKEYADIYQNPGASSISSGKSATAPKTFEVYLDIKKPFDISDQEARRIYIEDYIKGGNAMGINPYLSDAEYAKINTIDWTEGEDLREFLIDNGYDYDGLVLDEGATGGYGDEVKSRGKSYVVFSSEQVKNVDNTNPTVDPDIRFSLSEAVEETKDLLAVHNLTSEQVLKSIELGGLPMPSIAVVKGNDVHNEYGEISLIMPKDTIDPKANRANKVYGGDAWTPTYPRIEYKPSAKVEKKISDKYYGLAREIGYDAVRPLYNYVTDLERQLNNSGGESPMLEKLYDDTEMMNLYLQDSGKGKIEPIEKETVTEISPEQAEMNQFFIDALGDEVIASYPTPKGESMGLHRRQFVEQYGDEIRTAYKRFFMELYDFTETEADNAVDNTSKADLLHIVRDAYQYTQNKGVTVKTEVDRQATNDAIRNAAADGYKEWIDGLFKGVEEKTGIRNNQDYYTRSGNPRNWDALHWENTLENVVKTMKGQEETGTGSLSPYNSFASLAHKRYGSIAEIKADSNRLGKVSQEEYEAMGDSFAQRFAQIAGSIKDPAERNSFIATDDAAELIVDAVRTHKTKAGMLSYLQKWNKRVTRQTVEDVVSLVNDIANMPTGYFEAKPQRAVGFDEVAVFVIPYDADVKLKQELLNRGYAIAEYDPKIEGDRQRVVNQFEEYKFSLSNVGETVRNPSRFDVYGKDFRVQDGFAPVAETATEEIAPVQETISEMETVEFPDDLAPVQDELDYLTSEAEGIKSVMEAYATAGDVEAVNKLIPEYEAIQTRIRELQQPEAERVESITDADAPEEMDAPMSMQSVNYDPFSGIALHEISRSTRSYSDRNPGARHFLEEAALGFGYDVNNSTHGERWYNDELYYESGGEKGFGGTSRYTTSDIAELKDTYGYTWDELLKAAEDVAKGEFRSVAAKRVEYLCHKRLMEGYTDVDGRRYEPNQEYISFLNETFANEQRVGSIDNLLENADQYAPIDPEKIPAKPLEKATPDTMDAPIFDSKDKDAVKGQTTMFEPEKPKVNPRVAQVLTEGSAKAQKKPGIAGKLVSALVDKGMVFENLSLRTGNHELQAKYNYALPSNTEARAQYLMENGDVDTKSLKDIIQKVEKTGKTQKFYDYLYHVHNIDRMSLEDRFNVPNKAVFGDTVTADVSRAKVRQYEKANPEFKAMAEDVYTYNKHLRKLLVKGNVISQETADLWEKMYPHYVPVRRVDQEGLNINVPLDSRKTGVNNPIKRATGGSSDIEPLFETMAMRTEQTFRAIARNDFGIELMNTLGSEAVRQKPSVDEMIDTIGAQEDLLKPGTMFSNPTFAVFENGEKVEFEITQDMFDALKPAEGILAYRNEAIGKVGNVRRNLLTTWNPVFALYRNPIKDMQDMAINSQHPVKSYLNVPNAIYQMATNGQFAKEYHKNGGKSNTYFDSKTNQFKAEDNIFKKTIGMPIRAIETAGEFIEEIPRLAEYIASRKEGRSVERSMLDAGRVTTNFAAGGDFTKLLNSHGFTFLNASVQGASQHVRNIREAKQQGLKGYAKLVAKYTIAGLPTILLNDMLWDDDEEYEELNDYVKQNYYVVAKTKDGKFVRIPKGRTAAVMGELMEQMQNLVTGDDEVDFSTFNELFWNNIAPNNPIENNILAPIGQVLKNKAWYGDDLVPSRLQDLPAEEQYDESTDSISRWLGEKTGLSPYKINYLIDQYSGGLGDVFLPMLTPEAESGDNTFIGNVLAPWKKEITTDSVLNNRNPGDFYDLKDELEVISNGRNATDEDRMRVVYMDSVGWEMSDLYAQKREIQNSDLPDDEKYEAVREVQEQINELANNALDRYNDVDISGLYAEVGDRRYNYNAEKDIWYEIKPTNADGSENYYYQMEQNVTRALGITYEQYWNDKEEYNYAYEKPEQYLLSQVTGGYDAYRGYISDLWDLEADKDEYGRSISGTKKAKVIDYINNLDIDYGERIILFRSQYPADDTYNYEIVDYLNSREDLSYEEIKTILEYLDFKVDSEGYITWD